MKFTEIRDLTTTELRERLKVETKIYEQRKISHSISPLSNSAVITQSRREIARMKTEMRQREINDKINEK
ncbi:MAG: 50S ribosomal protein L29 [Candidatus Azobacteroides pseudotrichonymphae]|jgi:large subunit ribosomal protein L29|uniref:Large ribosomal subunit protein uL29 n=1 Tax=Azobacteroides pseudotrichonymphae genomovar. CFP2 TaxID=511995 RepID=B6YQ77_AZOPC|nr:50S ribosomal protein L29 [Candidatus Azobacteroides pseudotrichonymphae]MDR0530142.1 50S ribosomal protein L29 [Bacteroidales bacterium OttesenSCG-928-I14]BAG83349.1 50S ribosomal protein L29 [Candidatus Azobacteroides pseudotrichonymphae genomovar. CFP2]GMO36909.1 MAG: 50S ribosomal protein L29 [Candidatus Azobacteroides pseudotrichonymphae]